MLNSTNVSKNTFSQPQKRRYGKSQQQDLRPSLPVAEVSRSLRRRNEEATTIAEGFGIINTISVDIHSISREEHRAQLPRINFQLTYTAAVAETIFQEKMLSKLRSTRSSFTTSSLLAISYFKPRRKSYDVYRQHLKCKLRCRLSDPTTMLQFHHF